MFGCDLGFALQLGLILVVEKLDLGLLLLRRRLARAGWHCDLADLVHLDQKMSFNWKGQPVLKSSMSSKSSAHIAARNALDLALWNTASKHIDVLVEIEKQQDGDGGQLFEQELQTYRTMQARLVAKCAGARNLGYVSGVACRAV